MERYTYYAQGDGKLEEWFIYDRQGHYQLSSYKFKRKKDAIAIVNKLNQKEIDNGKASL